MMLRPDDDPLTEPDGPCTCDRGMIHVSADYAARQYPDWTDEQLAHLSPEQRADATLRLTERRHAATNSVYPCRRCRPEQFYRWADGHMKPGHDPARCGICNDPPSPHRTAKRATMPPVGSNPRSDLT
jgi:hypothetical protein